jgi:hypothetical protein
MSNTIQDASDLDANSILVAEYEYIAQTAFQANEDRSRVATFYLVSVGSFLAAAFTTLNDSPTNVNLIWAFVILFFGLSLYGLFTLLQLARLRAAWFESVQAMNRIKEYYLKHPSLPDLEQAFAWRGSTLPPRLKLTSVTFLSALQIAVLAGIMFGTAVAYYRLIMNADWLFVAVGSGVLFFGSQMGIFALMVGRSANP